MHIALIPAFNEEKSIVEVINDTKKYVDFIVVIDDFSTDKTGKLAFDTGAIVLKHQKNQGVGAAVITGLEYAKFHNPDIVVILDADGQHNPNDIPRLIQPIIEGKAAFVLGSRFLGAKPKDIHFIKQKGNKLLTQIINILVRKNLTDTQTGFRAINKKALFSLNLKSKFTYTQEMVISLCLKGFHCGEIPIIVKPRKFGSSKVVSSIFKYALRSLIIIFSTYLLNQVKK